MSLAGEASYFPGVLRGVEHRLCVLATGCALFVLCDEQYTLVFLLLQRDTPLRGGHAMELVIPESVVIEDHSPISRSPRVANAW
jgi:hypothetical protein